MQQLLVQEAAGQSRGVRGASEGSFQGPPAARGGLAPLGSLPPVVSCQLGEKGQGTLKDVLRVGSI